MTEPRISVIVPHYDDLDRLDTCLSALMAQTLECNAFEIIVGDNGTPAGVAAVEAVVSGRARVVPVGERGAGPARNGAAAEAKGDLLAFIDSDCVPDPRWLEAGSASIGPGIFAGGKMTVFVPAPDNVSGAEAFELVFGFPNDDYVLRKGFTVTANLFVMRDDFVRVGPFRTGVSEDLEWCERAHGLGLRIVYAGDAVVAHPARSDWAGLVTKTRRIQDEMFLLQCEKPGGRARWLLRTLALPASVLVHAPRILSAQKLSATARLQGLVCLARIRLWRFGRGLSLLVSRR